LSEATPPEIGLTDAYFVTALECAARSALSDAKLPPAGSDDALVVEFAGVAELAVLELVLLPHAAIASALSATPAAAAHRATKRYGRA
jgi:hypothetical protein